jgi:hypothetical protein
MDFTRRKTNAPSTTPPMIARIGHTDVKTLVAWAAMASSGTEGIAMGVGMVSPPFCKKF